MVNFKLSSKHLFLDVYNDYLLYAKKKQKNQSFTCMKYKFDKHILPFFESMYLEDITSKTSTTLDVYSHTDLTQEKRVINTLNSLRFNFFTVMKYKFKSILKRLKSL